jgi:hypothetical protein
MPYELIGAEELVAGDEDGVDDILSGYDLIGANYPIRIRRPVVRQPRPGVFNRAMTQAAAIKQAMAGSVVRAQVPTKARRLVLPMESTGTVAAGAAATITARPQSIAFRPQRIVIPSTIAPNFIILDIKVGNKSQLVQNGALPGEAFLPTLFDGEMEMDTVQTSQDFVLQVQNVSGAPSQFRAAVYGRAADY